MGCFSLFRSVAVLHLKRSVRSISLVEAIKAWHFFVSIVFGAGREKYPARRKCDYIIIGGRALGIKYIQ